MLSFQMCFFRHTVQSIYPIFLQYVLTAVVGVDGICVYARPLLVSCGTLLLGKSRNKITLADLAPMEGQCCFIRLAVFYRNLPL